MTEKSTYKQLTGEMDGFENFLVDNGISYSRRMLTPEEARIPEELSSSMDKKTHGRIPSRRSHNDI